MGRPRKDGQHLNIIIQKDLYNRLERTCDVTGQTKTVAVERALKLYFDKIEQTVSELPSK